MASIASSSGGEAAISGFLARRHARHILVLCLLAGGALVFLVLNIAIGSVYVPAVDAASIVLRGRESSEVFGAVIWDIRLPRALAGLLGGAMLAVAGLLLQVFFRNPIVGPSILGITSGASLMVSLVMLGGLAVGAASLGPLYLSAAALLGAMGVMMVIMAVASKVRDILTLLVVGLMVGFMASSVGSFLVAFAEERRVHTFVSWSLGSFAGFRWDEVGIMGAACAVLCSVSFFLAKWLNAFLLGENYAQSMGVNVKLFRYLVVVLSSGLAAVVTAFAGPVAFIGLAVPHIARLFLGSSDNRILIPGSILLGAIVTSLCDLLARTLFSPVELPISGTTALFGAPIVIGLVLKRRTSI